MRYLFGLLCVCGLVAVFPQSTNAQVEKQGATTESHLEQPAAPSSEPASEEPALQLRLDAAGVDVAPIPPRTLDGYTLEQMDVRVRRAKIGLGSSSAAFFAGGMFLGFAIGESFSNFCIFGECTPEPKWVNPLAWTGVALLVGSFAGMIASSILLRRRKRDRDSLREAHDGTLRRVQWDPTRSRLMF